MKGFNSLTRYMTVLMNYIKPDRHYHTLAHIGAMFEGLNEHFEQYKDNQALQLAILYHDVIYVAGDPMNEMNSAMVASAVLENEGVPKHIIDEVFRLILLTKTHQAEEHDYLGRLLIDLDLMELASPKYMANSYKVKAEFARFSDELWYRGREKFLESFLARPTIYQTAYGQTHWEADARIRMNDELLYVKDKLKKYAS